MKDPQVLAREILSRLDIPFGIVMDCNGFPNEHTECPGLNALVMARVATDPAFRDWLQFAKTMLTIKGWRPKSLQDAPDDVPPLFDLITVCRDGVHRSVACAELLASVLLRQGWRVQVEHMHHERWGKFNGDCKWCLSSDHVKASALDYALTIWRLV